ncbi:Hercynine oxygenase [Candidatus Magnetaquicoccaceae bacterium FCR-1]|uniref:Hercynine oxygenase n=1 Tax=Candidatus Magnetaquiglobus chichijimensis TaxID=3141448 RepID=A0ABQ0CAL1_9PROT
MKPLSSIIPFRGCCGHGDLAVAYASGGHEALTSMAKLLGFIAEPRKETVSFFPPVPVLIEEPLESTHSESTPYRVLDLPPFWLWRLVEYKALPSLEKPAPTSHEVTVMEEEEFLDPATQQPQAPRLWEWSKLATRMRTLFTHNEAGQELDVERTVRRLVRGHPLKRLPMRQRRRWGHGIQLILDRAERLIPYQDDLDDAALRLASHFTEQQVSWALLRDGRDEPMLVDDRSEEYYSRYRYPPTGTLVAVLGDMGALSSDPVTEGATWERMGRNLRSKGCHPVALLPIAATRQIPALLPSWTLLFLDRSTNAVSPSSDERQACVERLLTCLAPAVRIEPGLLREIRILLGLEAGVEADVWSHPTMIGRSRVAGTLDPKESKRLLAAFESLSRTDPGLSAQVIETIRHWHAHLPPEVRDEELLRLNPEQLPPLLRERALPLARRRIAGLVKQVATSESAQAWVRRNHARATPSLYRHQDQTLLASQSHMLKIAFAGNLELLQLPPGADLRLLPRTSETPGTLFLIQHGDSLQISRKAAPDYALYGSLHTHHGVVQIQEVEKQSLQPNRNPAFWKSGTPPSWADAWGWDPYGAWVEFVVNDVRQRMRWAPPGSFMMGSPESEPERDDNEGPQHEVTFRSGFWLCDTACTQEMWQAVMGDNPSHFNSPKRPVEQVNFKDVQEFIKKIEMILPGIQLGLPSESQWEYACRAGTTSPFSVGSIISIDMCNYKPGYAISKDLDIYYGLNTYDNHPMDSIDINSDITLWKEQTIPVATFPPNSWGHFDMHGNVWEWCQDTGHGNYQDAPTDGTAWDEEAISFKRVLRGGSWMCRARSIRSAYRRWFDPSAHVNDIGFRCARVQRTLSDGYENAEPVSTKPISLEKQESVWKATNWVATIDLRQSSDQASIPLPQGNHFQIESDCEILTFGQMVKPTWADAIGRDRFGVWAEFEIGCVRQQMRWIPPGRFLMGSPKDEAGRSANEGPQHEVTLQKGFWMFDTPCTQALWQEVMGGNPSKFKSPDRPVERVSFNDIKIFLKQIEKRRSGLGLVLPSEAQWEYACRAGSSMAIYFEDNNYIEDSHPAALDAIAWLRANSDQNFDLKSSDIDDPRPNPDSWLQEDDWLREFESEVQHWMDGLRSGTHRVKQKEPNSWGLYDMLGNVHETCQDVWYDSYDEAPTDGSAWEGKHAGSHNIRGCPARGGSWEDASEYVRSASRYWSSAGNSCENLGFRCVLLEPDSYGAIMIDRTRHPLIDGSSPRWASGWGQDSFGVFAEFTIGKVTQRMRWIPPGCFMMGSPEDEPGRFSDEGPQHEVTLHSGFWLADTPCTQELWEVVMGTNPSQFKSPKRPVEQVTFGKVQTFLQKIKFMRPGLILTLPSEAQWEYACRADSTTAIYTGKLEIRGENNAPDLDLIAWYGGNSGKDFNLSEGADISDLKEKQYPNPKAGTHEVRMKKPNNWGLYDMLGNVSEWCLDHNHGSYHGAPTNGEAWLNQNEVWSEQQHEEKRMLRGAAWRALPNMVRSACRFSRHTWYKMNSLGFRVAIMPSDN